MGQLSIVNGESIKDIRGGPGRVLQGRAGGPEATRVAGTRADQRQGPSDEIAWELSAEAPVHSGASLSNHSVATHAAAGPFASHGRFSSRDQHHSSRSWHSRGPWWCRQRPAASPY